MQVVKDTRTPKHEVNLTQASDIMNQTTRHPKKGKPYVKGKPSTKKGTKPSGKPNGKPNDNQKNKLYDPPDQCQAPNHIKKGFPVYIKTIKGKKMYWCAACGKNGRWSTTHHTGTHTRSSNKQSSDKWELVMPTVMQD